MYSIGRKFITIDKLVLKALLKNNIIEEENEDVVRNERDNLYLLNIERAIWLQVFDYKKIKKKNWVPGDTVKTDGISICFHLKLLGGNIKPTIPLIAGEQKRKRKPAAEALHECSGYVEAILPSETVVAFDPGRTTLLYGVQKIDNDNTNVFKLTSGEYYCRAGNSFINNIYFNFIKLNIFYVFYCVGKPRADQRRAHWNEPVRHIHEALSMLTRKTIDEYRINLLIEYMKLHEDELWLNRAHRRWANEDFRFWRLKHKVMDGFYNKVKKKAMSSINNCNSVRIAYGGASFPANGKHEKYSAPTGFQFKRRKLIFNKKISM
jgi:hypothetical protein